MSYTVTQRPRHFDLDVSLICGVDEDSQGQKVKVKMFDSIFLVTSFYSINISCTNTK